MTDARDSASGDDWRFPVRALITAAVTAVGAGMAMLFWMLIVGMGHGSRTSRVDLIWYVGIALLLGAAWSFFDAGGDIRLVPSTSRTPFVRSVGVLSYLLAATCVAISAWALAMILFF